MTTVQIINQVSTPSVTGSTVEVEVVTETTTVTVTPGPTTFLGLTDTPDTYVGQGGKAVAVNAGATGLEFTTFSGGGVTDHGALTGLSDDDHPQYLTNARGDLRYWPLTTDLATQAELDTAIATREPSLGNPASNGYLLSSTTLGVRSWIAAPATGVTSVGLALPAEFTISGSPVTGAGTLTAVWANESANRVLAGPATGSPATPVFRALVAADIPQLAYSSLSGIPSTFAPSAHASSHETGGSDAITALAASVITSGQLAPGFGGTGTNNTGNLAWPSGGGTAALLATQNVFTTRQEISVATASNTGLRLTATDAGSYSSAQNLLEARNSGITYSQIRSFGNMWIGVGNSDDDDTLILFSRTTSNRRTAIEFVSHGDPLTGSIDWTAGVDLPQTDSRTFAWRRSGQSTANLQLDYDNLGVLISAPQGTAATEALDVYGNEQLRGYLDLLEISAPAAPANTAGRLYCEDVAGKTRLVIRFATGAVQVIATEP